MIDRLFPKQFDNRFDGQRAALWLLGLLIALRLIMSVNSMFNTESVAVGADGFRLDSYGSDGARAVLMLFSLQALSQLALALTALLALVRYRAMVPFVFLLLLGEQIGRRLIVGGYSVERSGDMSAALIINSVLLALLVGGFALSLWPRRRRPAASEPTIIEGHKQ